jgi:hypothetical protein
MTTRAFVTAQISCCYLAVPPLSLCALVDIVFREEEESCDDAVRGEASILRERERERERVRVQEKAVHSRGRWCYYRSDSGYCEQQGGPQMRAGLVAEVVRQRKSR